MSEPLSNQEIDAYFDECFETMRERQIVAVEEYSLGDEFFEYRITKGFDRLEFTREGETALSFEIVPIGSWSEASGTWKWAFSDERFPLAARVRLGTALTEIASRTELGIFVDPEAVEIDFGAAQTLMTVAAKRLEADWTYSVPSVDGKLRAFLAVFSK